MNSKRTKFKAEGARPYTMEEEGFAR